MALGLMVLGSLIGSKAISCSVKAGGLMVVSET